jgi:putative tryptophan/tyrosine transport system substrate-binding protein
MAPHFKSAFAGCGHCAAHALAQKLVGLQPDIIATNGTAATTAVQRETRTIPIVFFGASDPVASSIVARLDRPSGNITGFANFEAG